MLEKYINLNVYQDDRLNAIRKIALVATSCLPFLLLFSRAIADAVLTLVAILFVVCCTKTRNYAAIKQPIVVVLVLLWLWFVMSSLFSLYDTTDSVLTGFVYIRFILFFSACISWIFTEIKALQFAVKIMTITIAIAASDALFQFITGFSVSGKAQMGGRLTSFLRRPDIGIYLAKLIFPLTALWIRQTAYTYNKSSLLCGGFLFFVVSVILLTGERTATVLSLFAISLILFIIGVTNKYLRKYVILGIICTFLLLILVIYNSPFLYKRALDFTKDIGNFANSLYGQLFKASILSWLEYGFFAGVGIRQFRNACPSFMESGQISYCDLHSHNIYLEILSESGLIGIILFCVFVGLCLRQVYKSAVLAYKEDVAIFISNLCLLGGLIIILFPISVTMSFITNWSATLNWLGISLCIAISKVGAAQSGSKKELRYY